MNTIAFNVLAAVFCILFLLYFLCLSWVRKSNDYRRIPRTTLGKWSALIILSIAAIAIVCVFLFAPAYSYRSITVILVTPVMITHLRNSPLGLELKRNPSDTSLTDCSLDRIKRKLRILKYHALLTYLVFVSMMYVYLFK